MNELLRELLFLPRQSSSVARGIDTLHYSVILITTLGSLVVAGFALYFVVRYRAPKHWQELPHAAAATTSNTAHTATATPKQTPLWFELSFIAFLLILFCGWWVIGFRQYVELEVPPDDALEVYATGKQWMWSFAYANGSGSKSVLYVPTKRSIKLTMTSRDVIHSFFVPEFRVKQDVVPGRSTTLWFQVDKPGRYAAYCAEYCGEDHSTMRATVVALPEPEYLKKLDDLPSLDVSGPEASDPAQVGDAPRHPLSLAEQGERVAVKHGCLRCHTVDGTPHIGPTWYDDFGADIELQSGKHLTVDAAYLTESMMDPLAKIRRGFPAIMPSYQGQLSAAETGALIQYIRTLGQPHETAPHEAPLVQQGAEPVALPTRASAAPREAPSGSQTPAPEAPSVRPPISQSEGEKP